MQKALIGNEFFTFAREQIDAARFTVDVAMYDWRWYADDPTHPMQQVNMALVRALRRGVKVRVLWQNGFDSKEARALGFTVRTTPLARTLHAKVLMTDSATVCAGSHNFTGNAAKHNHEVSIVTDDAEACARCARWYNTLFEWA